MPIIEKIVGVDLKCWYILIFGISKGEVPFNNWSPPINLRIKNSVLLWHVKGSTLSIFTRSNSSVWESGRSRIHNFQEINRIVFSKSNWNRVTRHQSQSLIRNGSSSQSCFMLRFFLYKNGRWHRLQITAKADFDVFSRKIKGSQTFPVGPRNWPSDDLC